MRNTFLSISFFEGVDHVRKGLTIAQYLHLKNILIENPFLGTELDNIADARYFPYFLTREMRFVVLLYITVKHSNDDSFCIIPVDFFEAKEFESCVGNYSTDLLREIRNSISTLKTISVLNRV